MAEAQQVALDHFTGPIDYLLHLVQKNEVDICSIPIEALFTQYWGQESHFDSRADFVGISALLMWIKSKRLLPPQEEDAEEELPVDLLQHLLDYCRFKEAAKELSGREEQQVGLFSRGGEPLPEPAQPPLSMGALTAQDLVQLFQELLSKASLKGVIYEEVWKVSDKMTSLRTKLKEGNFSFLELFPPGRARLEWIVTFLAILELMKNEEMQIVNEEGNILCKKPV